jgi:hypothetical protein
MPQTVQYFTLDRPVKVHKAFKAVVNSGSVSFR